MKKPCTIPTEATRSPSSIARVTQPKSGVGKVLAPGHLACSYLHHTLREAAMRSLPNLLGLMALSCAAALVCNAANHRTAASLQDRAAVLCQRSNFALGYLHGYEGGFHAADQDLQLGHVSTGIKSRLDARDLSPRSRMPIGDQGLYITGYRQGAEAGYADAIGEREFRAITELRQAADGLDAAT